MNRFRPTPSRKVPSILPLALLAVAVLFAACDVGIGGKVDVNKPELALSNVQPGDYLKGTVVLKGTAKDDIGVNAVQISIDRGTSFQNIPNKNLSGLGGPNVDWEYSLDTTVLADGELSVIIRAADESGRSTITDNLVFKVDNNAPIVLVTSQRSYDELILNNSIEITVTSYDIHNTSQYRLEVWAGEPGSEPGPENVTSWAPVPDAAVTVQSGSPWIHKFTNPFLGNQDKIQSYFRFAIFASDEAGNESQVFYHADSLFELAGQDLSLDRLDRILAGQSFDPDDGGPTPAIGKTEVEAVAWAANDSSPFVLYFDEDYDKPKAGISNPLGNGGNDASMVSTDRVRGYFEDDDGVATDSMSYTLYKLVGSDYILQETEQQPISTYSTNSEIGNKRIDWELDLGSMGQGKFRIELFAADVYGIASVPKSHVFYISDGAPTLSIEIPESIYFNDNIALQGSASYSQPIEKIQVRLGYGPEHSRVWPASLTGLEAVYDPGPGTWNFTSQDADLSILPEGNVLVEVSATGGGKTSTRSLTLIRDSVAPTVEIASPAANSHVNQVATLSGASGDTNSGIAELYLAAVLQGETPEESDWWLYLTGSGAPSLVPDDYEFSGSIANYVFRFDSRIFEDNQPITIHAKAVDRAGNESTVTRDLFVNQDSDLPVLSLTNIDVAGQMADNVLSGIPARVSGYAIDDDGFAAGTGSQAPLSYRVRTAGGSEPGAWTVWRDVEPSISAGRLDFNFQLMDPANPSSVLADGIYDMQVWTQDLNGLGLARGSRDSSTDIIPFAIDNGPPTLEFGAATPEAGQHVSGDFSVQYSTSDALGLKKVSLEIVGSGLPAQVLYDNTVEPPASTLSDTVTVDTTTLDSGSYNIVLRSEDIAQTYSTLNTNIILDKDKPTLEIATPSQDAIVNGFVNFRGNSDDNQQVEQVHYWIGAQGSAAPADKTTWTPLPGNYSWQLAWDSTAHADGQYSIHLAARDLAGNWSSTALRDFQVDQNSDRPTMGLTGLESSAGTPAQAHLNLIESNAVLRFVVEDDDMVDAGSIEISLDGLGDWTSINRNGAAVYGNALLLNASHNLSPISEGTHHFYLRVSDLASAKSDLAAVSQQIGPIYFMVDRNFPVLTETALNSASTFRSGSFELSGTVSDTNQLSKLVVLESADGGTTQNTVYDLDLTGFSSVSTWALANMPRSSAADGTYDYTITLSDASGKQTVLTRRVIIDTTAPELPQLSEPASGSWITSTTYNFRGSASDGSGSGIAKVFVYESQQGAGSPALGNAAWTEASYNSGTGQWVAALSIGQTGQRELHVYSLDVAGNTSAVLTQPFGLDPTAPVVTLSGGVATQFENVDFSIGGTYSDISGIANATVETSTDNSTFVEASPAQASIVPGSWSWDADTSSLADGLHYYRFIFTDLAGNATQVLKTVNLDRIAPLLSFASTKPSIHFTPSAATANGSMTLSGTVSEDQGVVNLQSLSYSIDGSAQVPLDINGNFSIAGIDTSTAYPTGTMSVEVFAEDKNGNTASQSFTLNVDQSSDMPLVQISSPANQAAITSINIPLNGSISDDDGVATAAGALQYRYSDSGDPADFGSWTDATPSGGTETSRNFTLEIASGSDGPKRIELRAFDIHGTVSAISQLELSVDTGAPAFSGLAPADGSFHNADFSVSGQVQDNSSVQSLSYRVTREGLEVLPWTSLPGTPSAANTPIVFSAPVSTSAGSGQYDVYFEASDGTFTRSSSLRFTVDKAAPSLGFDSPAVGQVSNNIIEIRGNAADNYGISSLQFRVVDANALGAERALPTGSLSGTSNWTISNFDTRNTTLLSYAENLGNDIYQLTLRAIVADAAGNVYSTAGGSDLVFRIDQNSDRPVISFDSLATDGSSVLTSTVLSGSVQDDDGVAQIIIETWDAGNTGANPSRAETVQLTSGSWGGKDLDWRVELTSTGNGERAIRVRALDSVDNNGNDFSAEDYSRTDSTKIVFALDTLDPSAAFTSPAANVTWSASDSFTVSGTASDATGISALSYKLDDNDFASGSTAIAQPWETWSFTIPQANLNNGPHTVYVQAVDGSGKTRLISRQLSVDKTGPELGILNPSAGSAVFGPLTITGTAADNAGGAGVASVSVGLGNQINPLDPENSTWVAVPGTTSWTYSFANINDFANPAFSTNIGDTNGNGIEDAGETWPDLWNFRFWVRAQDSAGVLGPGNISYLDSYTLQIDPKRDRPEIEIMSPSNGATVGGFLRIFGSAFDSQFVEKVQIAIDHNADGDYTNDPAWTHGALDVTENGVPWYLVSGTTSWNIRLNEHQEFDPSGAETTKIIRIKVRAKDYKVSPGDGIYGDEKELEVTFNKNFPQFSAMSLNPGDTVGGTVYLTGLVRDESDITRIHFNNEGPKLDTTLIFNNPGNLSAVEPSNMDVSSPEALAAGISVQRLGTSDPDYNAAYPGSYRISVPINTEAAGLYPGGAGTMSVKLLAEDNTSPNPFTNQYLVSFSVDNLAPSNLEYSGASNILGSAAELKGSVRDLGTVSGIDAIFVYLTNLDGELLRLQGGSGSVAAFDTALLLDKNNSTYADYRMFIDNRYESGDDSGPNGDNDGISEFLTLSAGTYYWSGLFDSTLVADGAISVNLVASDFAGNTTSASSQAFIANNAPRISSIQLATDLNRDSVLAAAEYSQPITAGFSASNFKARNSLLGIRVNTVGGNSTLRYSVSYAGVEQNAVLTNNVIVIDTSAFPESASDNDTAFLIKVFDSTTSDDADDTNELSDSIVLNITIDNVDDIAPTISVSPFGQTWSQALDDGAKTLGSIASYELGVARSGETLLGHLEYAEHSNHDNAGLLDADVSGRVVFRGKVWDNQQISRIRAQIPGFDGGSGVGNAFDVFTAAGGALSSAQWAFGFEGNVVLDEALGNHFNWTLEVNTAAISTGAANNVPVTVSVEDFGISAAVSSDLHVDVVPYISEIQRNLDIYNTFRSKWGTYPVQAAETGIVLRGFNLPTQTDGQNWLRVYNTAGTDYQSATLSSALADRTEISFALGNVDRSGYLRVSTNGIEAINLVNDNELAWNREDDGSGIASTLWTDDRYLSVWAVGDYFATSTDPEHLSMDIRQSTGRIMGMWSNYADSAAYYAQPLSQAAGNTRVHQTYDPPEWTDVAIEQSSNTLHSVILENYYGGVGTTTWGYLASYRNAGNRMPIERLGNEAIAGGNNTHADGYDEQLYQFQNARIAIADEGSDRRYIAYYDAYGRALKYAHIQANNRLMAADNGNMTNQASVVDGIDDFDDDPSDSGPDVGQYLDIQIDPDDGVPVIVYYDTTNKTLKIARAQSQTPVGTDGWNKANVLPPNSFSGQYVSMKVDKDPASPTYGDLFVSYYKVSTGDLVFIHAADVDGTGPGVQYSFSDPVVVDQEGAVGMWTDIALIDGKPVISYLNSTQIGTYSGLKMARYIGDGSSWSDSEDWEHEVLPAESAVFNKRTNIVGLDEQYLGTGAWKYAIGYASATFDIVYWQREQ